MGGFPRIDPVEQELEIQNDLATFYDAEREGRALTTQTLGGQITHHDGSGEEAGKPLYFVGTFRGSELHLTKVDGTVQMRPQFHHLDAEDQRARIAAHPVAEIGRADQQQHARGILQRNVRDDERDRPEDRLRKSLLESEAEPWMELQYVDECEDEAYEAFREKLFVQDVEGAEKLKSKMGKEEYLDAISAPRHEGAGRRRKRPARRKEAVELEDDGDDDGEEVGES